jgi:hypothetical protein
VSWIVKRFGKYRRKLWNDMENMEETVSWNVKWSGKYGREARRIVIILITIQLTFLP